MKPKYAWIATQADLNTAEAENIQRYLDWASTARPGGIEKILSDRYLKAINRRMFGDVWIWAGKFRNHNLENEFTSPYPNIQVDLRNAWEDIRALRDMTPQEIAVRLHHRIVKVHPFVDGNGRTSREMADLALTRHFKLPPLTWGTSDLRHAGEPRDRYIAALRQADRGHYVDLVGFCTG